MNGMNNCNDDQVECPLCMEQLEVDDLNFYPCTCGYQICRFCWHRIRTDENELCPACRKAYPENPADFTPLSQEQISALKAEKRQRDQQRKAKITENRKHLANVRVVQKNLVFVVGLPPRLADPDILKKHEYFGKYGKIHKVVINPSTTYAGVQGPSASAYVTYLQNNDSLRAIQSVNNIMIDGRLIKTSLGTTKYCSHFMKNQQCPKPDCMYLHELGDSEASFTKEEMHQGKHQEYEKRLHDALIALTAAEKAAAANDTTCKTEADGTIKTPSIPINDDGPIQSQEAWPSLSVSPVNKEMNKNGKSGGHNKENNSSNKNKKGEKTKGKKNSNNNSNNLNSTKDLTLTEKQQKHVNHINIDDDINSIDEILNDALSSDGKTDTPSISDSCSGDSGTVSESASGKSSPGTFPDNQNLITATSSSLSSSVSSSSSGSSSSSSSSSLSNNHQQQVQQQNKTNLEKSSNIIGNNESTSTLFVNDNKTNGLNNLVDPTARFSKLSLFDDNNSFFSTNTFQPYLKMDGTSNTNSSHLPDLLNGTESDDTTDRDAKLILKGLHPQLNSLGDNSEDWEAAFKYVMMRNNKHLEEQEEMLRQQELQKRNNLLNNHGTSQLHGGNGHGGDYHSEYFPNLNDMGRLSQSQALIQQQQQQQQQHQLQQQQQLHRNQNNMFGTPDGLGGTPHGYPGNNMSKFFDFHKTQQTTNTHPVNGHSNDQLNLSNLLDNRINSHFLDQHTNSLLGSQMQQQQVQQQQQQQQQQKQQQQQQQRLLNNKYDQMGVGSLNNHNNLILNNSQQQQQQQQNRLQNNHYTQNSSVDDDLGFDPFFETQKALAELIENENVQQQQTQMNHSQRTRMPPPGFSHMNAFGIGVPRPQVTGSKILPFMMGNGTQSSQQQQQQQQQPPQSNNWNPHMLNYQQQQLNEPPPQQHNKSGFGSLSSDWTTLDPAIVSFRQFPSFLPQQQQQQQQPPPQHSAADMFMPQLNQQQQQGQGFGHHGLNNLQSSIMNQQQQQNSPAQVNFSHSNWLNTDQNIYNMNNLTNGFSNNFDKFSIPMPPGFQNVTGNKQQKAECIN